MATIRAPSASQAEVPPCRLPPRGAACSSTGIGWTRPTARRRRSSTRPPKRRSTRSRRAPRQTSIAPSRPRGAAFDDWSQTTPAERSAMLWKWAQKIEDSAAELSALESANVGKPKGVADFDLEFSIDNLRFFAGAARVLEGKATGEYLKGWTSMVRREPVGVVGQVAPWNYPLMMAIWKVGPALAAGNTVVLKPAVGHAADRARAGRACRGRVPEGRVQRHHRPGPDGRSAARDPSRRRHDLAHRRHRHGQGDCRGRGADREARPPRAGRQGAGRRLRRCRPVGRGRGGQAGRLLQQRPGLHRRDAHHRRQRRLREPAGRARAGGPVDQGRQSGRRRGSRHGPARQRCAARARDGLRRSRARLRRERGRGRRRCTNGSGNGRGFFYDPTVVTDVEPGLGDHPGRGVRPGRDRPALHRRRGGDPLGERRAVRPRVIGLDARRQARAQRGHA